MAQESFQEKLILYGLPPERYEHPLDRKALDALEGTPGLEKLLRWVNEHGIELMYKTQYTGSNIKVSRQMFPEIYEILLSVCETIHLKPVPELYIEQNPFINAFTVGSEKPIIVLHTKTVECLTPSELKYIIGHEAAHIKSQHCLYHMLAGCILPYIGEIVGRATLGIGSIGTDALQLALLTWSRKSEFTADRGGLLACQDINAVITACMKMAGTPESHYKDMDPKILLNQAREFQEFDDNNWNAVVKFLSILGSTHPWTVMRAKELDKWIKSGDYQKILDERGVIKSQENLACRSCGNEIMFGAKFCNKCGTKI